MKIRDLLRPEAIELSVSAGSKEEMIDRLISLHEKAGNLNSAAAYREAILAREAEGSTRRVTVSGRQVLLRQRFPQGLIMARRTDSQAICFL